MNLRIPRRDVHGHKGTFGSVGVMGGCAAPSTLMIGAPTLSALGALRAGCGLVRIAMPEPIMHAGIALTPSATGVAIRCDEESAIVPHEAVAIVDALTAWASALVIGPGMGVSAGVRAAAIRAVQQDNCPVVVDADGLNVLAGVVDLAREVRGRVILTPHPGEFARVSRGLGIEQIDESSASRQQGAESLAQKLGVIVVLKGAGTVVSDGQRTWVCEHRVPALAVPGSGDVLAGVIAGLIAQFHTGRAGRSLWELACIAVEAHALAAETWSQCHHASGGMLASELAGLLPRTLEELRDEK
jgi:hydroxyethylthiazole kinase-like uncharacterized protein yjeF